MNETCVSKSYGRSVREDGQGSVRAGRSERDGACFIQQRIGEYIQGGVSSTLMARDYKSASDLIVGVNNEPAARDQVLQILRETYGTQAVQQWGTGMLELVQQKNLLQQGVHETGVSGEAENRDVLGVYSQVCASDQGTRLLRDLRSSGQNRCTPHRHESAEQRPDEPDSTMQKLSPKAAQDAECLLDMWQAGQGIRLLREALSAFQEIWRPDDNGISKVAGRTTQRKYIVRRLTPIEAARLQGFPDEWCEGLGGSDSAIYKAYGNGLALPCAYDVMNRIARFVEHEKEE